MLDGSLNLSRATGACHGEQAEATRDAVRVTIGDFLWSDRTGLPVTVYSEDEVKTRAEDVFEHVFRAYPTVPSPFYDNAAA